jgi:secretion/DNA translocation related TadE-like protein
VSGRGLTRTEVGSASLWVLTCCALLIVVATAGTVRAVAILARHRAEAAADLAALAAAGRFGTAEAPCDWASRTATANGARLRTCRVRVDAGGRSGVVDVAVAITVDLPVVGSRTVIASARGGRLPP